MGFLVRLAINEQVSKAFNYTVYNTYVAAEPTNGKNKNQHGRPKPKHGAFVAALDHHVQSAMAKFVLCPSGLGFDTYRLWETLLLGSIPVVESNTGFDRTYSNLPVLVVRNYSDLTPQLLHRAYPCFVKNAHKYNYKHLTEKYWLDAVFRAVHTGDTAHITEQHPFRNKYCDFM